MSVMASVIGEMERMASLIENSLIVKIPRVASIES